MLRHIMKTKYLIRILKRNFNFWLLSIAKYLAIFDWERYTGCFIKDGTNIRRKQCIWKPKSKSEGEENQLASFLLSFCGRKGKLCNQIPLKVEEEALCKFLQSELRLWESFQFATFIHILQLFLGIFPKVHQSFLRRCKACITVDGTILLNNFSNCC